MKILITCPPMINRFFTLENIFINNKWEYHIPHFTQTMSENELINIIGDFDIWIIGDDPATDNVFNSATKLKFAIKWGVGTDNVDIVSCKKRGIQFTNTPAMFGEEVSDIAIGYMIMLSRELHNIHNNVLIGNWYKPCGYTLKDKNVALLGYGNIGQAVGRKLNSFLMNVKIFDPFYNYCKTPEESVTDADSIIITCPLNKDTYHLVNKELISCAKKGVFIINVSRGSVINEIDLIEMLGIKYVQGCALDVLETEPLYDENPLKNYNVIFGSHNGSNTREAVDRVNMKIVEFIKSFSSASPPS